ncbi:MAG: TraI/MobA(P) family conjugative relaxase [Leptospirales bacterium]
MIYKKIPNPHQTASKAIRVEKLANYIVRPEKDGGTEKYVHSGTRGFLTDEFSAQKLEMIALSEEAIRSSDPIEHYVLSWREGERPPPQQIEKVMDILMGEFGMRERDKFGMNEHQCIYGLHQDTDNFHLHIMLNRADPLTGRAIRINNGFDIKALQKIIARIEHEQGWTPEAHARYSIVDDKPVLATDRGKTEEHKPSRIRDAERRTGEKSTLSIAQERIPTIAQDATGWQDFHGKLAEQGMEYRLRGAGAVLLVGETPTKPSDVDRKLGRKTLEKRWGVFEAPTPGTPKKVSPVQEPVNDVAKALGFGDYAKARRLHLAGRKASKAELDKRIENERKALFERQREERQKTFTGSWKGRGAELNALRSVLAAQQAGARSELQDRTKDLREQFSTEYPSGFFPDFEEWVRKTRGKEAAEQYRYAGKPREIPAEIRPTEPGRSKGPEPHDIRDYLPEVFGREVRYSNAQGKMAFVDSGPKISVLDQTDASVLAALQLARQKYGKDLVVSGPEEFQATVVRLAVRNNIPIANPELQERIQKEKDRIAAEREQQRKKTQAPPPRSVESPSERQRKRGKDLGI